MNTYRLQSENFYTAAASELNTLNTLELNDDHTNINTSHLNKFDDEEDYSILPNDIVDFNNMEDLVEFFNSNEKNTGDHEHGTHHYHHHHQASNFKSQANVNNTDFAWLLNKNEQPDEAKFLQKGNSNDPKPFKNSTSGGQTSSSATDADQNRLIIKFFKNNKRFV